MPLSRNQHATGLELRSEERVQTEGRGCNQRLSGLMGEVTKIYFQTPSHSKHEYLRSKQHPTKCHSAEPPQSVRVPLSATKKSDCKKQSLVRIKGLEPPRLSASDPKSDVATNYTISAMDATKIATFFIFYNFVAGIVQKIVFLRQTLTHLL